MKLRPVVMKLSDITLSLLKNFSTINQSILFKQGSKLRTISVMKNIYAEASIGENLPKDFGIYDLNQFLNGLTLHNSPDLDFVLLKKVGVPDDIIRLKDTCEKKGCKLSKNIDEFVKCEPYQPKSNYASIGYFDNKYLLFEKTPSEIIK